MLMPLFPIRWHDKPVQFIVAPNGEMGMVGEHSLIDGGPATRMCDEILEAVYSSLFDHGPEISNTSGNTAIVATPLDFACTPRYWKRSPRQRVPQIL